jgi:nucleoside-diphosphate-sugar epimerase
MSRILVAGGSGFIGSHLCDMLLAKGYFVICLDNLLTGSMINIKHLLGNRKFIFLKRDVVQPFDSAVLKKLKDISAIFNLASPASPIDYQEHPEETALTNSFGTLNLLKLALKNNAKFLLASTSEIYGDPLEHPQKETYWGNVNSFGVRSCYDEGKRFAETLTYIYINKYGLDARVVRIFNTYGPRMQKDDGRVVSNFINQAIERKPLTVYGKGNQTRSFCYVSDLVTGLEKAMFTKGARGEVFNLGNPDEYTVLELARNIVKLTGSKSKIVFKRLPSDDPTKRKPDITKAKKILGWEPKVSLEKGLNKTIDYYKSL